MSNFKEVSKGILLCSTVNSTKINCTALDMSCIAQVCKQDSSHSYVYQQIITSTVSTFNIKEDIVRKVKQMSILQLHQEYYGHILQKLNNLRSTVNKGNIYDIEKELVDIIRSIHDEKRISEI